LVAADVQTSDAKHKAFPSLTDYNFGLLRLSALLTARNFLGQQMRGLAIQQCLEPCMPKRQEEHLAKTGRAALQVSRRQKRGAKDGRR
jgi:hypothetical protein